MKIGSYRVQPKWAKIKLWTEIFGASALVVGAGYATGFALDTFTSTSIGTAGVPIGAAYTFAGLTVLLTAGICLLFVWTALSGLFDIEEVTGE
jgi:hypothetical protein